MIKLLLSNFKRTLFCCIEFMLRWPVKEMKAILFLAGKFQLTQKIRKEIKVAGLVGAADSGALHAKKAGVSPHYIVGDFDSLGKGDRSLWGLSPEKFISFPSKKDKSDGHLALEFVLSKKPKEIVFLGALGGKLDYLFSNLFLLTKIPASIPAKIVDAGSEIYWVRKKQVLHGKKGDRVSMLPIAPSGAVLKTKGLLYALHRKKLHFGSHGLSNQMTKDRCEIHVLQGGVFVFHDCGQTGV